MALQSSCYLALLTINLQHNSEPVVTNTEGLHSRSNSSRGLKSGSKPEPGIRTTGSEIRAGTGSCVTDLERMSSMKGITVLRGRVPNMSRTLTDQFGEEHVESYL